MSKPCLVVAAAAMLATSGCNSHTAGLVQDASGDPFIALLTPLALPGAMIMDVFSGFDRGTRGGGGGGARDFDPGFVGSTGSGTIPALRPSGGGNSAQCQQTLATAQQMRNAAEQCRMRQANMASLGGTGRGTVGQAGAFNDCYNNYMNSYNSTIRIYNAQCR
jgi:hypothetical protein